MINVTKVHYSPYNRTGDEIFVLFGGISSLCSVKRTIAGFEIGIFSRNFPIFSDFPTSFVLSKLYSTQWQTLTT